MTKLKITIPIESNADPGLILDLAQAAAEALVRDLETYDESGVCDENEVSVEEVKG